MADEDNGIQRKTPLPKGMGNTKSNAQVFGIIGQQVRRINELTKAVISGNHELVAEIKANGIKASRDSADQHQVLWDIDTAILKLVNVMNPIAASFAEMAEDGPKAQAPITNKPKAANLASPAAAGVDIEKSGKAATKASGGFGKLAATLGGGAGAAAGGGVMGALTTVGVGIGAVGLGLGVVTGALYLGAAAVDKFGTGLKNTAEGLDDLNKLDLLPSRFEAIGDALEELVPESGIRGAVAAKIITGVAFTDMAKGLTALNQVDTGNFENQFNKIGGALSALMDNVSIMGGIGLHILDGTAFNDLASGLEALDGAKFDSDNLEKVGLGIKSLTKNASSLWGTQGALIISSLSKSKLGDMADGLTALGQVDTKDGFEEQMGMIGRGINTLVNESTSFKGVITTSQLTSLSDSLPGVAEGINALQGLGTGKEVQATLEQVGAGMKAFLAGSGNVTDVVMTKLLNPGTFIDLASGMQAMMNVSNANKGSENVKNALTNLGDGMGSLLEGTSNMSGSFAMWLLSGDTLKTVASSLDDMSKLTIDKTQFENIGEALNIMLAGISGENLPKEGEDEGVIGYLGRQVDRITGVARASSAAIIDGPVAELASAMKKLEEVGMIDAETLRTNAQVIIDVMQGINDDVVTDDFDYLGNFIDELKELEKVDIRKISQLGDALSKYGLASRQPQEDLVGPTNNTGKTLNTAEVTKIVQQTINQTRNEQNVNTQTDNRSTINSTTRMSVRPVPHTTFISK